MRPAPALPFLTSFCSIPSALFPPATATDALTSVAATNFFWTSSQSDVLLIELAPEGKYISRTSSTFALTVGGEDFQTKEVALTIHNTTHVRLVRKTLGRPFYIYISAFQEGEPDVGVAEMWPLALGLYAQPLGLYRLFFSFWFPFAPACGS